MSRGTPGKNWRFSRIIFWNEFQGGVAGEIPGGILGEFLGRIPGGIPSGISKRMPDGIPREISGGILEGIPSAILDSCRRNPRQYSWRNRSRSTGEVFGDNT